jgi:hypothetical protein
VTAAPGEAVVLDLGAAPVTDPGRELFDRLDRARLDHELKVQALAAVTADRPAGARIGHLHALALPRAVESAVVEILSALD